MKRLHIALFNLTALIMFSLSTNMFCQDKGIGIGVVLGEPTGFTSKFWLNQVNAIDVNIGYSFVKGNGTVFLVSDYLWHKNIFTSTGERFPVHFGLGVSLRSQNNADNAFGVRGVVGIALYIKPVPIEIYMEGAGILNLNKITLNPNIDIGGRYFFY